MILMEGGAARDLYYTTTRWRARPDYHSRVCQARASERCVSASGFRCWQSALKNRKPSLRAQTHRGSRLLDTPYLLARRRVVAYLTQESFSPATRGGRGRRELSHAPVAEEELTLQLTQPLKWVLWLYCVDFVSRGFLPLSHRRGRRRLGHGATYCVFKRIQ